MTSPYLHETGTHGAPSILFLHGIGASGWMWEPQLTALADFHCLAVDLPGHGKSNQLEWVSLAETADSIAKIIQAHATHGRAHIVGLSLGGYIAMVLLERHPNLADHVVISGVTDSPMPNRKLLNPQLWMMSAVRKSRWLVNLQAKALGLSPQMQTAFTDNFLAMTMETYRRIAEEVVEFSVPTALSEVTIPTLIVAGDKETDIIKQTVQTIPKMMSNAQGRLAPNASHGWNVQSPALFNAMVRAWITDAPLPMGLHR